MADINELISNKIAQIKYLKERIESFPPEPKEISGEDMLSKQYRSAAQEMMRLKNPEKAMDLLAKAEQIDAQREKTQKEIAEKGDINSPENIKQMAIQLRSNYLTLTSDKIGNLGAVEKERLVKSITNLRSQLMKTELGRAIAGEVESEVKVPTPTPTPTPTSATFSYETDIMPLFKDDNNNGIVDNLANVKNTIDKLIRQSGLPDTDPEVVALRNYIEDKKDEIQSDYKANEEKRQVKLAESQKAQSMEQSTTSINAERAKLDIANLDEDPNDVSYRDGALNTLLRSESGAAIGKDEVLSRIRNVLPSDVAQQLLDSQSGVLAYAASKLISDEQFTLNLIKKYLPSIDVNKLKQQLNIRAGKKASDIKKEKKTDMTAPKKGDTKTVYGIKMTYNGTNWE